MTGIHLMRTGIVESNVLRLNEDLKLPYIPAVVAQKVQGYEKDELAAGHMLDFCSKEYVRLQEQLADAAEKSSLPKEPSGQDDLNELLLTLRTEGQLPKAPS